MNRRKNIEVSFFTGQIPAHRENKDETERGIMLRQRQEQRANYRNSELMARRLFPRFGTCDQAPLPIHAFDLIIADECHRGYTAKETAIWRHALDHFDAIKIGLTATPAAHTTSYFKEVVYRYEYERAVREGFLVDYDVVAIRSNVRMQGVFLKEGEQVSVVDAETGNKKLDEMEDGRQFDSAEVEEKVTSPDSNRKILGEVKKYALEHEEQCGRFPKMLIFAVNDLPHTSHADQLVDIARDVFGRGDAFVRKITGSPTVDRPLQRIREFPNRAEPGRASPSRWTCSRQAWTSPT